MQIKTFLILRYFFQKKMVSKGDETWCTWYKDKVNPCPFRSKSKNDVREHMEENHLKVKVCNTCLSEGIEAAFMHESDLNMHLQIDHGIERSAKSTKGYTCRFKDCGETYASKTALREHQKVQDHVSHIKTCRYLIRRSAKLEECGKLFENNTDLVEHRYKSKHMQNKEQLKRGREERGLDEPKDAKRKKQ